MSNPNLKNVPENLPWEHEKKLKYVNKRHDIRFGDVMIYKDETTQRKVIKKEKKSGDKNKLSQDVMMANERMNLQSPFIQKMLGWSISTEKGLCSTNHFVGLFYDYPTSDLRNEIAERKKKKLGMSDGELSNIISNSLRGLDYIHSRGLAHGDIRPELIGCEKDKGSSSISHSVLLDRLADQSSIERAQTNRMLNKKQLFMSPQLYKLINTKGKKKPLYNRQKNDLFALGMTVISAGNGKTMNNCYVKGGDFNVNKLNEHKDNFNLKYQQNPELCRVVSDLVQIEEEMRPDPTVIAKEPQVIYQEYVNPEDNIDNHTEVAKNTFFKRQANPEVKSSSPQIDSHQPHPLDHEEHYVKPGEEVVYGEPKVVRTYIDENSRRTEKGEVKTEIVRLKNAYDPNRHDVEQPVNAQYQSTFQPNNEYKSSPQPGVTVYKKQAESPNYTNTTPTYTFNAPTTTFVNAQPKTTFVNAQPTTNYENGQPVTTTYVEAQPTTTTYINGQPVNTTYVEAQPTITYENGQPVTTYVKAEPIITYENGQPVTTYVNAQPTITYENEQPVTTYVNAQPTTTYENGQPVTTYVNAQPTITYENGQPVTTTFVNAQPTTTTYVNGQPVTTTYVNAQPEIIYTENNEKVVSSYQKVEIEKEVKETTNLEYVISERQAIEFHNLKFEQNQSETEPENRFEEPVKSRIAEEGEDLESFPPEGKIIRKKIKIKNAEGEIIEEYDEPVKLN